MGRAFGLHRALDTTGAIIGPLIGYWYLSANPENYRTLYLLAVIPAAIGVLILWLLVKESAAPAVAESSRRFSSEPRLQASVPSIDSSCW